MPPILQGSALRLLIAGSAVLLVVFLASCSPMYVLRASWEEAGILLRRKKIEKIVAEETVDGDTQRKLKLVLAARDFTESLGLEPKGSFTTYSKVDRDVLVWVLNASQQLSFTSVTWWFPIVGRVPYKGFFDKEDGIEAARDLKNEGHDVNLRPSPAFSTLGWFNDPLLSTTLSSDDVSLVDTVVHEIVHNTIWIPGNVPFNETMANVLGSIGSRLFFEKFDGAGSVREQQAANRFHDSLIYARYLKTVIEELTTFYQRLESGELKLEKPKALEKRAEIYEKLRTKWELHFPELKTEAFRKPLSSLNNASIIAQQIYFDRPWIIADLFEACGNSFACLIEQLKAIERQCKQKGQDPFELAIKHTKELRQ